jgi:hypothetical protein
LAVRIEIATSDDPTTSIASRPTFVTTRTPLLPGRDVITIIINFGKAEAKYFLQRGWTRIRKIHLSGKSVCPDLPELSISPNIRHAPGLTRLQGRNSFGVAKARASAPFLRDAAKNVDGRDKPRP